MRYNSTKSIGIYFLSAFVLLLLLGWKSQTLSLFGQTERRGPFLDGKFPRFAPVPWKFQQIGFIPVDNDFFTRVERIPRTSRFVGLTKNGKVLSFEESPMGSDVKELLDLSSQLSIQHEAGLMGITFHPEFNDISSSHYRELFLYYTYVYTEELPIYDRLSRFKMSDNLENILLDSEEILIQQIDRDHNHNAGDLFFDNDGYLYLAVGDEGKWDNFYGNAQKTNEGLFSGLLRIDPDMDASRSHAIRRFPIKDHIPEGFPDNINENYLIPNDNPWVDASANNLEEFYAIGLRNPWATYYDSSTDEIWVADVGDGRVEEINLIEKGANGQWAYQEGLLSNPLHAKPAEITGIETPPIFTYDHEQGNAVIGGLVYYGEKYPELGGNYLFADWESGNVWALERTTEVQVTLLNRGPQRIIDFFVTTDGSICVILMSGQILELQKNEITEIIPSRLTELDVFEDLAALTAANGIFPYEINSPLWSDGAIKRRWIALPQNRTIAFQDEDPWNFPKGTVFIKHFEQAIHMDSTKNLETRFFVIDDERQGYGLTYRWNEDDSDAFLIGIDEEVSDTLMVQDVLGEQEWVWNYPTRSQCMRCHNPSADFVLGVKTGQLNREVMHEGEAWNQLELWQASGLFDQDLAADTLLKMYAINDASASLEDRVRSYLDANCSHCHDGRPGVTQFDARFTTPLTDAQIIDGEVFSSNSIDGNKIIAPGNERRSEMLIRDESLSDNQMPPIAREVLDTTYLNTLKDWINELSVLSNHPSLVENIVTVYPNPITTESFIMQSRAAINSMALVDLNGRTIPVSFTQEYAENRMRVFLKDETMEGIFLLIVDTAEGQETKRLMVSR
ncbi:MAG: PQQ-dependent sugar dehydrogenase [Cytophagales bacterium]|nr:PQQ-dependent sugar dehydrogenase [Cytophagales bacterium]